MRFQDLGSWLRWQETLHPRPVDLGLERVAAVWGRLPPLPPTTRVITVAGTNGKGSCVAVMEAVLAAAGFRVLAYTSPHLHRYNERIRVDTMPLEDRELIRSFAAVDAARGDIRLTYFEFGTLAALHQAAHLAPEVVLLEVGLGGRLDAVNVITPDVTVITTVGLDHQDWLGPDRERIGAEKAGILRPGVPLVLGDHDPPASVLERAVGLGCPLARLGVNFHVSLGQSAWRFEGSSRTIADLPVGPLRGPLLDNAACAIEALDRLPGLTALAAEAVRAGCGSVHLPGRLQCLPGPVEWLIDLAHNPPAAQALVAYLADLPPAGQTHAILGMLSDKDAGAVIRELVDVVDRWWFVDTPGDRGRTAADLAALARSEGVEAAGESRTVAAAVEALREAASDGDRALVLGSFSVVGPAFEALRKGGV